MSMKREEVFRQVLELPVVDRAELAQRLVSSLEPGPEPGVEAAWQAEVPRRLREIRSGAVQTVPWEAFRERLRTRTREQG